MRTWIPPEGKTGIPSISLGRIDDTPDRIPGDAADGFDMPYGVSPGENGPLIRDVVSRTIALYRRAPRPAEWGGCLAIDPGISAVIGTCSFVNAPDGDGTVEIAYFTFPQFERKGYGTAMASELLRRAIQSGAVRKIIAHTLPRDNASTRIPGKPGLIRAVEAEDPEEGTVWRWEYRVRK